MVAGPSKEPVWGLVVGPTEGICVVWGGAGAVEGPVEGPLWRDFGRGGGGER
jgi:hypothetical protein